MIDSPGGNGGVDTKRTTFERHDNEMANNDRWLIELAPALRGKQFENELMNRYENLRNICPAYSGNA